MIPSKTPVRVTSLTRVGNIGGAIEIKPEDEYFVDKLRAKIATYLEGSTLLPKYYSRIFLPMETVPEKASNSWSNTSAVDVIIDGNEVIGTTNAVGNFLSELTSISRQTLGAIVPERLDLTSNLCISLCLSAALMEKLSSIRSVRVSENEVVEDDQITQRALDFSGLQTVLEELAQRPLEFKEIVNNIENHATLNPKEREKLKNVPQEQADDIGEDIRGVVLRKALLGVINENYGGNVEELRALSYKKGKFASHYFDADNRGACSQLTRMRIKISTGEVIFDSLNKHGKPEQRIGKLETISSAPDNTLAWLIGEQRANVVTTLRAMRAIQEAS